MSNQTTDRRAEGAVLTATEVFLVLMTVAVVASLSRLFNDNTWVGPMLAAAVVAHLTVAAIRRLGRGLLLSGIVSLVVMTLQISWTHYRETLRFGLPTGTTRDAIDADLNAAWNLFSEVKAPTEPVIGFLVVTTIAIWLVAYLADWAAFRLWSALEAVLPSFAFFVFVAFFGADTDRLALAALYLAAVVGFQLFHHLMRQAREVRWLAGTQLSGTSSLARTGAFLSVIVVIGALIVGPALPGSEQEALVDLDPSGSGNDTRVVVSPIVDIRGRLVDQADVEAFTVRSAQPSYWRLASLDTFDGQVWGTDTISYGKASGTLDDDFPVNTQVNLLTQDFAIANMGAVWLPAAYEPRVLVEKSDDNIRYEAISGTLLVSTDLATSNGLTYTLESEIPRFDPAALAAAPRDYPPGLFDRYTELPADFSPRAEALAVQIVTDEGATNDYERALALQDYFRDNFTYDLQVGAGHSSARIDQFLDAEVGYCEQFAGAFASMARSLGIPARVAVGFTWGEEDVNDSDLYRVRGEHAHAWPEVYIPGSGWVPFEPTPGRGAPNDAQWTGVSAAQANESGLGGEPTVSPAPTPIAPDELPTPQTNDGPTDAAPLGTSSSSGGGTPGWLGATGVAVVVIAALFGLYSFAVIGLKRNRANRRFTDAANNRERVDAVWVETVESLRPLGLSQQPAETVTEFSDRAARETVSAAQPLDKLSSLAVQATYSPGEPDDETVETARGHRDEVAQAVQAETSTTDRLKESLDPRPLLRR